MIKEIWCMPHSHLDVGYTHPQPMLLELQKDYLDQALELIEKTQDYPEETQFRWTVEGNYVLRKWLETASPEKEAKLKKYIQDGHLCVTALPMHTTPGVDARELVSILSELKGLEERLETRINVAISHDVDGQPWTLGQLLLDSGVDFYLTGINIHYGGLPFQRPYFFQWETSDGRKLPTFLGEHYSLFSQYGYTWENDTKHMDEGLTEHAKWLEERGYQKDFMFLSATNPPQQYDNNPPDWNLPDLIQRYNDEGHAYKIRIVTAQMLRDRLYQELQDANVEVPVHGGDWTDYWNFGCASTARETRVSRLAKGALNTAEMLESFDLKEDLHYDSVKEKCQEMIMLYDEHTWGAAQSIDEPDSPESISQLVHKWQMAYHAADLAGYLAGVRMNQHCQNPSQSDEREGVLFVNASSVPQTFEAKYSAEYRKKKRLLNSSQGKCIVPYLERPRELEVSGIMTLAPFTTAVVSFEELDQMKEASKGYEKNYQFADDVLETPYYKVKLEEATGRILQITDRRSGRELLSEEKGYGLFEPIREQIDKEQNPAVRETLFGNSVYLRNHDISQWNHEWKAKRTTTEKQTFELEAKDYQVSIVTKGELGGTKGITQRITFYTYSPIIRMEAEFFKEAVYEPESLLFAVPAKLKAGWQCSYDTAGEIVKLDAEQLGKVCRDYETVDTAVSLYGEEGCLTLSCPDAPMVQVGDFQFGKENEQIERVENPLLLAWPLNNYWSTNFMANQSGSITLAYELNFHENFRKQEMLQDGVSAKYPVTAGLAVHGPFQKQTLLEADGNCFILNVFPDRKKEGILVLVKNQEDTPEMCSLTSPVRAVRSAALVTPGEDVIRELPVEEGKVTVTLPARTMKLILLK